MLTVIAISARAYVLALTGVLIIEAILIIEDVSEPISKISQE